VEANPHFCRTASGSTSPVQQLYVNVVDTGLLVEMTDIRAGAPARAQPPGPVADAAGVNSSGGRNHRSRRHPTARKYLKKEQKELLEAVRERAALREEQDKKKRKTIRASRLRAGAAVGDALQLTPR